MWKLSNMLKSIPFIYYIRERISKFLFAAKHAARVFKRDIKEPSFDWDFYYLLKEMEYKLSDMKKYFETSGIACNNMDNAKEIGVALNLLHTYFDVEDMKYTICKISEDTTGGELLDYRFAKYVNTRNASRFLSKDIAFAFNELKKDSSSYQIESEELYKAKCLKLFFDWIEFHLRGWWD